MELMTIIEILAVILGLLSVYFTVKQNIWCWPTGIAMVVLYVVIFYNIKLYSDMLENLIYIFLQIYGWYYWVLGGKKGSKKKDKVPVKMLTWKKRAIWAGVIIVFTIGLGFFMATKTDAALPYLDALTTVMSLTAQWLMGKKILENWMLWITVDVFALFIYSYKGLWMTTGLYFLFLILASRGLIEWYKDMKKQKQAVWS